LLLLFYLDPFIIIINVLLKFLSLGILKQIPDMMSSLPFLRTHVVKTPTLWGGFSGRAPSRHAVPGAQQICPVLGQPVWSTQHHVCVLNHPGW
jgi:hypothetical protein